MKTAAMKLSAILAGRQVLIISVQKDRGDNSNTFGPTSNVRSQTGPRNQFQVQRVHLAKGNISDVQKNSSGFCN